MKQLSIVIVTYNSEEDIYDCIDSILTYSDIPLSELEIIIVDNNSHDTDKMFTKLHELYGENIIMTKNTHNGGYGQGNNIGIQKATAPIIFIMNPDVRMMEPVLKTVIDTFNNSPKLCMYGMKQMQTPTKASKSSFVCTFRINGYISTIIAAFCTRFEWYIPRYLSLHGSCFFVRKSLFEKIGLFDESIFMYGEEDDIRYRFRKMGYKKMKYNHKLHYIHKTKEREPSLDYEIKILNAIIRQNEKKGYSAKKTIINMIRNTNLRISREFIRIKLGKKDTRLYGILKEYKSILRQYLAQQG